MEKNIQRSCSPTYIVSVSFARYTAEDADAGSPCESGFELRAQAVGASDLARIAQRYDTTEPSCDDIRTDASVWFSSSAPQIERRALEGSVATWYNLHLDRVDGHAPTADDYIAVARVLGVSPIYWGEQPDLAPPRGPGLS